MKISLSAESVTRIDAALIAIGVRQGELKKNDTLRALDEAMEGALTQHLQDEDFRGKPGDYLKIPSRGSVAARWIVLVGLGPSTSAARDARIVAVRAAASARQQRSVAVVLPSDDADAVRSAAEGLVMGAYRYTQYLTGPRKPTGGVAKALLVVSKPRDAALLRALEWGSTIGECINLTRDLVNAPPNDMNPPALADVAKQQSAQHGIECRVLDKKQIEKEGMNLLLAVNRGSGVEPRFFHMQYKPKKSSKAVPKIVFVGKGLTFDSGGLCIKPAKSMLDMKCDLAGAAVTIAVVVAASRLQLPVEVHGIVGSTENMTGENAYRPGDVFPSLDGKTVEIINTDAEGRLVLADALAYALRVDPDYLVDHATLTGACMVALGPWTAGLFANDDELAQRYVEAAEYSGESFWRMPLNEDLREGLKSDIADLKHTGDSYGGAISAALFLREFVGASRWVHLDIAGPAMQDRPHGVHPKGGTGFAVTTALRFLEQIGTTPPPPRAKPKDTAKSAGAKTRDTRSKNTKGNPYDPEPTPDRPARTKAGRNLTSATKNRG